MYFNRKCKITFISHGATIYSEEGRFSDVQNYPPLSELGVQEISNIVGYLKRRGVRNDAIYASPSVRTVQSAMMISKLFKQDFEILDELTSRAYGDWNNMSYEEVMKKFPNALSDLFSHSDMIPQGGSESSLEFINRTKSVLDKLVDENSGNRILVVTYPDVIQASICAALNIPAYVLPKIYIRTGSATQISYFDDFASLVYSDHVPLA